jgi:hypothetical protein
MLDPYAKTSRTAKRHSGWHSVGETETRQAMLDEIFKIDLKTFVLEHEKIERFIEKQFNKIDDSKPETSKPKFKNPQKFCQIPAIVWWQKMFICRTYPELQVTLWVFGRAKTGKSSYIKSLGNHQWFKGSFKPHCLPSNCDFILFDDLKVEEVTYYKDFINGDPVYVTGQWLKPTLIDQGAKYGKSAISICWATIIIREKLVNLASMCNESRTFL